MKQDTVPAFPGPSTGNPLVVDKRISLSPVSSFLRDHCGDGGLVAKLSPTFCNPMDYSPPGSSVHGVLQEWVAISFSRGSSQPRNQTHVSCIADGFFTAEPPGKKCPKVYHEYAKMNCLTVFWKWLCERKFSYSVIFSDSAYALWVTKEILPYFCRLLYLCVVCKISLHAQIYFAFLILHFKLPVSHQEMLFGMLQTQKCCLIGNKWKPWRMNQK